MSAADIFGCLALAFLVVVIALAIYKHKRPTEFDDDADGGMR